MYQYEKDCIIIIDSLNCCEVLYMQGEGGLKWVVKKEYVDGSVMQSQFDVVGRFRVQMDVVGRIIEYSLDVVMGFIMCIIMLDGRVLVFYYNYYSQLMLVIGFDGLEICWEYDEWGCLIQEIVFDGDIICYCYDNLYSDLFCVMEDVIGSWKIMMWSCYGQLLSFIDCFGYVICYDYDCFGQVMVVYCEEGLSQYCVYDSCGQLIVVKDMQGYEMWYEYNVVGDLIIVIVLDGSRNGIQYDVWGKVICIMQGGLMCSMEYDVVGWVICLISENGSYIIFCYDVFDWLIQEIGFDGCIQCYYYDLIGKFICSEDEGLVIYWYYDEVDCFMYCIVNGEIVEWWQYDECGWLIDISYISEGYWVMVYYGYDSKGCFVSEYLMVYYLQMNELFWQYEIRYVYNVQGLVNCCILDSLFVVEWLIYGSGWLLGMKFGDILLVEYICDCLYWEMLCSFGCYEFIIVYIFVGQLQSQYLNSLLFDCDYIWNDNGEFICISSLCQIWSYSYSIIGRLIGVYIIVVNLDICILYIIDLVGNCLFDLELYLDSIFSMWLDNCIVCDVYYFYWYDCYGRLMEKIDFILEGVICMDDECIYWYYYDSQYWLVYYMWI